MSYEMPTMPGDIAEKFKPLVLAMWGERGEIAAHALVMGGEGRIFYAPAVFTDSDAKDAYAASVRSLCVAVKANACVFVTEAWMAAVASGDVDPVDGSVTGPMPSERDDRVEVVIMQIEVAGDGRTHVYMAKVNEDRSLGEFTKGDSVTGRLSGFLPQEAHGRVGIA